MSIFEVAWPLDAEVEVVSNGKNETSLGDDEALSQDSLEKEEPREPGQQMESVIGENHLAKGEPRAEQTNNGIIEEISHDCCDFCGRECSSFRRQGKRSWRNEKKIWQRSGRDRR
jgi:hypothetical protein